MTEIKQAQTKASKCLFVDDNLDNIYAAQNLGIRSILFNRYNERYLGEQAHSFEELDQILQTL